MLTSRKTHLLASPSKTGHHCGSGIEREFTNVCNPRTGQLLIIDVHLKFIHTLRPVFAVLSTLKHDMIYLHKN